MIFSMKMTSGLTWTRMGKIPTDYQCILIPFEFCIFINEFQHSRTSKRAEKVAEITSWLKSHPVSSVSRTSCELQVLDSAIVEKIEDAVEKAKVTDKGTALKLQHTFQCQQMLPLCVYLLKSHSCALFQVKKSTKKVRVTVKPHLLFRVSMTSVGVIKGKYVLLHFLLTCSEISLLLWQSCNFFTYCIPSLTQLTLLIHHSFCQPAPAFLPNFPYSCTTSSQ